MKPTTHTHLEPMLKKEWNYNFAFLSTYGQIYLYLSISYFLTAGKGMFQIIQSAAQTGLVHIKAIGTKTTPAFQKNKIK